MRKLYVTVLLLFVFALSQAQNRASIRGKIIDTLSNQPLELATVAVINPQDTSLLSYTLSDKTGAFNLSNINVDKPLRIVISYVGFENYRKNLQLKKGDIVDLGTIPMERKSMSEVTIIAERSPITIRKDTVEFNAEAFKVRPNAVVEELLKKLPGVQVDQDGTITVNGKSVSKLVIDGKEFFGNDPRVASKNLDADLIDKIQVYDDRENDPDHLISDAQVSKIINLKMKKAIKKSTFGKVYAGAGTRGRFELGGLFNTFRDTLQVSLIGLSNNLNRTGFSWNELYEMGGFNRSGYENLNDGTATLGGQVGGGMQRVTSTGVNINNDYGKKLKMNLLYFYSNSSTVYDRSSFNQQYISDTTLFNKSNTWNEQGSNKHSINGLIDWKPDTLNQLRYRPKLSFDGNLNTYNYDGNTYNNVNPALSERNGGNSNNKKAQAFQHDLYYYHRFKRKGHSLTLNHNLQLSPSRFDYFNNDYLQSYTNSLQSEDIRRFSEGNSQNKSVGLDANYRFPVLKKWLIADVGVSGSYLQYFEQELVYNLDTLTNNYNLFLADLSIDQKRQQRAEGIKSGLTMQFNKKLLLILGLTAQWQNVGNYYAVNAEEINKNVFNWLPSVRIEAYGVSMSYNASVGIPSINSLQPFTRYYNQLYTYQGNPNLVPTRTHSGGLQFYKYWHQSQINLNWNASASLEKNVVVTKSVVNANGVSFSTPVNMDGRYYAYMSGNFGKRFKKTKNWQLGLNTRVNSNFNRNYFMVNNQMGLQSSYRTGINQGFTLNYKDAFEVGQSYEVSNNSTKYQDVDYKNLNYYNHRFNSKLTVRWPKRIIFDMDYTYSYNQQISAGFQRSMNLLNAAIALQMLKKDRGQLKLSVYDLLDQNISINRYEYGNSVSTSESRILKRYILLGYQFKFNKINAK
ncbi:MAG: outer membrane beta-barrel protein [Sphingobacteriaceae bacterium]